MKTASVAQVAAQFNVFLEASQQQPVLVTRDGQPVAVLVAVRNQAEADRLVDSPPRSLRSVLQTAHEQIEQSGGIPHEQFWQEVEQATAARQESGG